MKSILTLIITLLIASIAFGFLTRQHVSDDTFQTIAVPIEGILLDKTSKPVKDKYKVYIFENREPQKGERCKRHTYTSIKNPGHFEFSATGQTKVDQTAAAGRILGYEEDVNLDFNLVFERYVNNPKQPTGKDTIYYWPPQPFKKTIPVFVNPDGSVTKPLSLEFSLPE